MSIVGIVIVLVAFMLLDKYLFKQNRIIARLLVSPIIGSFLLWLTISSWKDIISFNLNNIGIITSIFLLINMLLTLIFYRKSKYKNFLNILKIVSIVLFCELSIFNFKHYYTLFNKEIVVGNYETDNYQQTEVDDDKQITYYKEDVIIDISKIKVNSFYFLAYNGYDDVKYDVVIKDKESKKKVLLNEADLYKGIESSYYKIIHNNIPSKELILTLKGNEYSNYTIDKIVLNPKVPILFSYVRVLALSIISILIYFFRPSSKIYQIKITHGKTKALLFVFDGLMIFISLLLCFNNPIFVNNRYYKSDGKYSYRLFINQYQALAESFADGQVSLKQKPSKSLLETKNPYNLFARNKNATKNKEPYLWDTAYYKGKYYVYFGVVPVVMTYLPYYAITGSHIPNNIVLLLGSIGIIIAFSLLLKKIAQKYFPNISLGAFALCLIFAFLGNHFLLLYAVKRPDFYTIPIVWALMFSLLGLYFWFKAKDKKDLDKKYLILGSLCMALVSGCRPQLLLLSFAFLIIFKEDKLFSKKGFKNLVCLGLPYVIIALLMMGYNYIRFDSIFDFGATYNLTTNDMNIRGFSLHRTFTGLFYYLFAMPNFGSVFPFALMYLPKTSYIGISIFEKLYGGAIALSPVLLLSLISFKFKKYFPDKKIYHLGIFFSTLAIIIIIFDTNYAGILPRYFLDFNFLLVISSLLVILSVFNYFHNNTKVINVLNKIFLWITVILVIYNFFLIFVDLSYDYKTYVSGFYNMIKYLVCFWL